MAIITLVSASGAPGVTTTALALAVRWPRPVMLVEADPRGGSSILAGFFKGTIDQPGLLQLVVAERQVSCVRDRVAFRGLNQTTLWGSG